MRGPYTRPSRLSLFLGQLVLGNLARKILPDRRHPTIQKTLLQVIQHNVVASPCAHMGDAVAHGPGAQNSYCFHLCHKFFERRGSLTVSRRPGLRYEVTATSSTVIRSGE